jgi:GMP synthase-like glutamine amidotransferase
MMTDGILAAQAAGVDVGARSTGVGAQSVERFQEAYDAAARRIEHAAADNGAASGVSSLLTPLLNLNSDSVRLAQQANQTAQTEMKPSELMQLTMRTHEFLFHCELVANVANRSSDGMQQLFRQQS